MADAVGDVLLAVYRGGGVLARPLVPLVIAARVARGKEDKARLGERYGEASAARPPGRLVWVHAASVGETNAVLPLVRRLTEAGLAVLFTTTTITSAEIAAAALPPGAFHQYAPLDITRSVGRFLAHWRPDLVVFAESELWPTMLTSLEQAGVPLIVVNGRVSDRSFRRWQRFGPLARALFSRIGQVLAQSDKDGDRFRALGAPRVAVSGNLKFDAPPLAADADAFARLTAAVGDRPVWVAASTHEGEEAHVAAVHRRLRADHPAILTVLVPRHPSRGDAVRALVEGEGLAVAQRSRGETPSAATDIYLADTLGELGLFFRLTPIAFLGGSLVATGGHNPIEPVRLGAVALHGPHVHNFAALFELLDGVAPGMRVADAGGLAEAVARLVAAPAEARRIAEASAAALSPFSGALDRTMTALAPYLSPKAEAAR